MKKFDLMMAMRSALISLVIGLTLLIPAIANQDTATVSVDGRVLTLDQPPVVYNDRVMVPLRGVFENLGAYVTYLPETHSVLVSRTGMRIALMLNSSQAMIDGAPRNLDSPPVLVNGNIMVPLRFVSEALGANVKWVAETRSVNILSGTGGVELPFSPISNAQLIQSVSSSSSTASAGQKITVTMKGTPGGTASMSIGGGEKILMDEVSPGTYVGTYTIPARFAGSSLDVAANLVMPDGRKNTKIETAALSVKTVQKRIGPGAVLPLTVAGPNPASTVPQVFDLWGTTKPGALVRLHILAEKAFIGMIFGSHWDEVVSTQVAADANGDYHFRVDTGNLGGGTRLKVHMTSEDKSGAFSKELDMELTSK